MGRQRMETANRLIWGIFFVAIGILMLTVNLGMDLPHGVWNYWPFLLLALGTARLVISRDGDGYWLVLAGLYGWISIWNIGGLTWGTAWPIFVIAGGLSVILKPVVCGRGGDRSERSEREGRSDRSEPGSGESMSARGGDHVG